MSCGQWAVFTKLGGGAIRFASQPSQFIEQGSLTNEPNELPVFPILALSSSSSSSSPSSSFPGIFPSDKIPQRCFLQWWGWGLDGSFHNYHKLVINGPESDHCLPLSLTDSLTDSLTHWLLFSILDWCDMWPVKMPTQNLLRLLLLLMLMMRKV